MYIISKHRDYYDGAVGMGIDKTIIYKREYQKINDNPNEFGEFFPDDNERFYFKRNNKKYEKHDILIIGFCGKLYQVFCLTYEEKTKWGREYKYNLFYDVEEVKQYFDLNDRSKWYWQKNQDINFANYIERFNSIDATEVFRKYNTPVFAVGEPKENMGWRSNNDFIINPILKDYEFQRIVDPYTAFQEIQMYISGVLGSNNDGDDIEMTEKQKVAQHGMDKWNFRRKSNK